MVARTQQNMHEHEPQLLTPAQLQQVQQAPYSASVFGAHILSEHGRLHIRNEIESSYSMFFDRGDFHRLLLCRKGSHRVWTMSATTTGTSAHVITGSRADSSVSQQ